MFCEQCGEKIEIGKRFCSKCEDQNTKIIEIPKSDIVSINDVILGAKKVVTASDVLKKIAFAIVSILSSLMFCALYSTILIMIIPRTFGKFEILMPITSIFSLVAGVFTFVLIYKLYKKIKAKLKNKIGN